MELIVEKSLSAFLIVTVLFGGGVAFLTGRAVAKGWRPFWQAILYAALLGCVVRFLHWGLFLDAHYESWRMAQGDILSVHYYLADTLVLMAAASLGFRFERAAQMTRQYRWIYERDGPLGWRERPRPD